MLRVESAQPLFQSLNNVLVIKQCSDSVIKEIKGIMFGMCILDNIDSYELESLIKNIIEGLKKLETAELNTREQLCQIPNIKDELEEDMGGYVTLSRKKLVVVKEELYDISLVHELSHFTQDDNSYNLPNNYDYILLVQKAMREGEASYYQALYTKERYPSLISGEYYLKNIINTTEYNIFLEFYQDMRELLGIDMLNKWKSVSKDEDFMQEIEKYMQEHYQCSIASFYQTWCAILYYYMNKSSKKYNEELYIATKYHEANIRQFEYFYEQIVQSLSRYPKYLHDTKEEIKQYKAMLESPQKLEQSMNQFIIEQKKELREYIEENGPDETSKEWEEEIKTINFETYREAVLNWKLSDEQQYQEVLKSQKKDELEKTKLEYQKTFLIDSSLETLSIEELETLKNQQFAYLMQRRNQLESTTLKDTTNKHMQ